jgi:hypothetical protein
LNRMEVLQRMNLRSQFDRESIEFPMTPKWWELPLEFSVAQ